MRISTVSRLLSTAMVAAVAAGGIACDAGGPSRIRPNVVLIVSDDAGYADFGSFGDPEMPTPAIDSIAANGVRFTQAYNAASVCSPSRAGLNTGRYPQRFGHEFNLPQRPVFDEDLNDLGLPLSETTMADAMRELGYTTVALGKWHLGAAEPFHPLERGFDEFYGFLFGSRSYFPLDDDAAPGFHLLDDRERQADGDYLTDVLAREAATRIERLRDRPFFMSINFNAVHTPMHAKPEQLELFGDVTPPRRQALAAMTVSLDEGVATILSSLRDLGLDDETIVFFVNDNGGATNNASRNGPLRGQKGDKFEGGIRVPALVQWPARLPRGVDYDLPVTSMDIFPTVVAAASGEVTDGTLDGVDLVPYLTGETAGRPHETLFWRRGAIAAARSGDWKLIRVNGEPVWLFDLATDPYETTNLIDANPARARDLVSALDRWEAETVEPRWRTEMIWTESQIRRHSPGTAREPAFPQQPGYTPTVAGAPSTDIFLGTLTLGTDTATISDVQNVTDRDGYDNQPAFEPGAESFLYTSARDARQSDIYRYDIAGGASRQVTQTLASEFSATPLPSGEGFSSIRESASGQLLWRYASDGASLGGILEDVQPVGYHAWGDDNQVLMFVLGSAGRPASLQLGDVRDRSARVLAENPGRSLHRVPGRHAVSFVRKVADDEWWIEVFDLDSGEFTRLLRTRPGREDYAWTPDGRLVMGDESKLYVAQPGASWVEVADLAEAGVVGISRISVSDTGTRIALVGNRQD